MSPLFLIPLFYLAAVLQTWLTARMGGAVPDLVALVAICWLTTSAGRRGGFVMALAGIVCDLNSNGPVRHCRRCVFCRGPGDDLATRPGESRWLFRSVLPRLDRRHQYSYRPGSSPLVSRAQRLAVANSRATKCAGRPLHVCLGHSGAFVGELVGQPAGIQSVVNRRLTDANRLAFPFASLRRRFIGCERFDARRPTAFAAGCLECSWPWRFTIYGRLIALEWQDGADYRAAAAEPVRRTRTVAVPRGKIVARDGTVWATISHIVDLALSYRWLEEPVNPRWLRQWLALAAFPS